MPTEDQKGAAPSAPAGEYTYYEAPGDGTQPSVTGTPTRPLPPVPGQSGMRETAVTDTVTQGLRALNLGENRGSNIESFVLRQLGHFKGDYSGEAITEWVEKIDLLKDMLDASDAEIIRIIPLRMSSRAVEFLRSFLTSRASAEHTWPELKKALLTQFGGKAETTQLVSQLQQARMGRNTPVREFALQVGRLARLAYPELSSDVGTPEQKELQRSLFNRIALEQFTAGLPPLLSRPIFESRETDFQKAVDLAAHHEEINARFMRRSTIHAMHEEIPPFQNGIQHDSEAPYPYSFGGPYHYMAPVTTGGGSSGGGTDSGTGPGTRYARKRQNSPGIRQGPYVRSNRHVTCYRCNRQGHYKRECKTCTICGEWGHTMADCRNIVCAACKGNGHPANKCPKNGMGRGQTRLNTNY